MHQQKVSGPRTGDEGDREVMQAAKGGIIFQFSRTLRRRLIVLDFSVGKWQESKVMNTLNFVNFHKFPSVESRTGNQQKITIYSRSLCLALFRRCCWIFSFLARSLVSEGFKSWKQLKWEQSDLLWKICMSSWSWAVFCLGKLIFLPFVRPPTRACQH